MIPVVAWELPAFGAARGGRGGARRVQTGPSRAGQSWGGQGGARSSAAERARRHGRPRVPWDFRDQL